MYNDIVIKTVEYSNIYNITIALYNKVTNKTQATEKAESTQNFKPYTSE